MLQPGKHMILTHQREHDLDIVKFSGRLVMADAANARENLKTIVEGGEGKLILDLTDLTFIDSSGCAVLISAFKAVRAKGGRMILTGLSRNVQALLELTRLNEIFELFVNTDAALKAMRQTR